MNKITLRNMTSVYFVREGEILCLYRIGSKVADRLFVGAAGGHFEEGEMKDPTACILREMREELSLGEEDISGLKLRYITQRLKNGEIRQNYYFFAELKGHEPLQSTEGILRWVRYDEFPDLPMPVSAKHMMTHYLAHGRHSDVLYAGITEEAGTYFVSLSEF